MRTIGAVSIARLGAGAQTCINVRAGDTTRDAPAPRTRSLRSAMSLESAPQVEFDLHPDERIEIDDDDDVRRRALGINARSAGEKLHGEPPDNAAPCAVRPTNRNLPLPLPLPSRQRAGAVPTRDRMIFDSPSCVNNPISHTLSSRICLFTLRSAPLRIQRVSVSSGAMSSGIARPRTVAIQSACSASARSTVACSVDDERH